MNKCGSFLKKFIDKKTLKFFIVGVINSVLGMGVMFLLFFIFNKNDVNHDLSYWVATAANYVVGGTVGYFLNKYWTFGYKKRSLLAVLKFVLTVATCYLVAYVAADKLIEYLLKNQSATIQKYVAMAVGAVIYPLLNYFGQRFFAFAEKKKQEIAQAKAIDRKAEAFARRRAKIEEDMRLNLSEAVIALSPEEEAETPDAANTSETLDIKRKV